MGFKEGIINAVNICMHIRPEENVSIISDRSTQRVSLAIKEETLKITKNVEIVFLEEFGKRPLKEFPRKIETLIKNSDASFYAAQSIKGEIYPFRRRLLDTIVENKVRHAHMPNINEGIVSTGLSVDNIKVQEVTNTVFDIVNKCKEIIVKGSNGTDITAEFESRYRWVNFGSVIKNNRWSNLPGAEVFTFPKNINGVFIVDGILGDYFIKYRNLRKNPVQIEIENGKVASIRCENKIIEDELRKYIRKYKNSDRVGDFALGTNIFLKRLVGVLLQDEKFPTIHIAFGNPYPKMTGAEYSAKTHIDAVTRDVSVWVDGRKIMESGKYLIDSFI